MFFKRQTEAASIRLDPGDMNGRMHDRFSWKHIFLIYARFHGVFQNLGMTLGMSFLRQRFHGDLLASFDPGVS